MVTPSDTEDVPGSPPRKRPKTSQSKAKKRMRANDIRTPASVNTPKLSQESFPFNRGSEITQQVVDSSGPEESMAKPFLDKITDMRTIRDQQKETIQKLMAEVKDLKNENQMLEEKARRFDELAKELEDKKEEARLSIEGPTTDLKNAHRSIGAMDVNCRKLIAELWSTETMVKEHFLTALARIRNQEIYDSISGQMDQEQANILELSQRMIND